MRPPRILITRAPHQASALAEHLRTLGTDPILIPTIEIVDPTSFATVDTTLANLDTFHWLIFTSANAVEAFQQRLNSLDIVILSGTKDLLLSRSVPDPLKKAGYSSSITEPEGKWALAPERPLSYSPKVAAIGPATASALAAINLKPDLIPPQAVAESLTNALLPHALQPDGTPTRFLLIRAEEARDHLPETLRAGGAEVTIAPVYRTVIPTGSIDAIRELFSNPENYPDAITFTSSSTVRNLFALLEAAGVVLPPHPKSVILSEAQRAQPKDLPPSPPLQGSRDLSSTESTRSLVIASIGPITSATLRDLGHPPQVEATEPTTTSLAENLVKHLSSGKLL